jgi:hypothetical protein
MNVNRDTHTGFAKADTLLPGSEKRPFTFTNPIHELQASSAVINFSLGIVAFNKSNETIARLAGLQKNEQFRQWQLSKYQQINTGTKRPVTHIWLDGEYLGVNLTTLDVLTGQEINKLAGIHNARFFYYLASMQPNNLILEGQQLDSAVRHTSYNKLYGLRYSPSEDEIYLYDPLSNALAPKTYVANDCNKLINKLAAHDRIRLMCWNFMCSLPKKKPQNQKATKLQIKSEYTDIPAATRVGN